MLPPSMFGGNGDNGDGEDIPFNEDIWESQEQANEAFDLLDQWNNGLGFSTDEWFDMIGRAYNFEYDNEGNLLSFDFDWESEDGQYFGSGHAHA